MREKPKTIITTAINDKHVKIKKKRAAPTGELELFKEIWNERPHMSEMSHKPVMFDVHCFHHLLTKGAYPEHRLNKDNIVILTRAEHNQIHSHTWKDLFDIDSRWLFIYERYVTLKGHGKERTESDK